MVAHHRRDVDEAHPRRALEFLVADLDPLVLGGVDEISGMGDGDFVDELGNHDPEAGGRRRHGLLQDRRLDHPSRADDGPAGQPKKVADNRSHVRRYSQMNARRGAIRAIVQAQPSRQLLVYASDYLRGGD